MSDLALGHYHLGMSLLWVGDLPKASAQLKRVLELLSISGGVAAGDVDALERVGGTYKAGK